MMSTGGLRSRTWIPFWLILVFLILPSIHAEAEEPRGDGSTVEETGVVRSCRMGMEINSSADGVFGRGRSSVTSMHRSTAPV